MPRYHLLTLSLARIPLWLAVTVGLVPGAVMANTATTPVAKESPRWLARHEAINEEVRKGPANLLWIGDSIVENWYDQGKPTWDKYYAHRGAANLGIGGDRTEHLLWRLDHGNIDGVSPKLAIVMMGQNNGSTNTAEEIAEGVTAIVTKLHEKLPETRILLLGIFYRGEHPNEEQKRLAQANEIFSRLADDKSVFYMNINQIFLNPDGTIPAALMPDFEHPSAEGHRIWAEAIEAKVSALLGDTPVAP